jgi:hypothetical protein
MKIDTRDLTNLAALLAATPETAKPTKAAPKKKAPPVAANDNEPAPRLAWPALERLAHRGDAVRAFALRHWKNLCYPGSGYDPQPIEDNEPETIEIRPSEAEMLRAVGWTVSGEERSLQTGKLVPTYEPRETQAATTRNRNGGTDTRVGGLLFRDGKLIEWGVTAKGRPLKPVERPRAGKGGQPTERSEAAIWAYLKTPADTNSPMHAVPYQRPFSGEPAIMDCYEPLPREEPSAKDRRGRFGVEEARAVLRDHGCDGAVPFKDLPLQATMCADALVPGRQWVGGVKQPKPLGEISAAAGPDAPAVRLMETADHLSQLRRLLREHAKVLDLAITNATAREIGIAMGKAPAYAERAGPLLIDAALDTLLAIDETARTTIAPREEKLAA